MEKFKGKEIIVGRLPYGADLLDGISEICTKNNIQFGWLQGLGAVQKARIGFYDQVKKEYHFLDLPEPLEITQLTGNISLKDGSPMVHAHATLADSSGKAYGGHLAPGTIVFACEVKIEILDGPALKRQFDQETGLALWQAVRG